MRKLLVLGLFVSVCCVLAGAENEEQNSELQNVEADVNLDRVAREARQLSKKERQEKRQARKQRNQGKKAKSKNRKKSGPGKKRKGKARRAKKNKPQKKSKKAAKKAKKSKQAKKKAKKSRKAKKKAKKSKQAKKKARRNRRKGKKKNKGRRRKTNTKKGKSSRRKSAAKKARRKALKAKKKAARKERNKRRRIKKQRGKNRQTCPVSAVCLDTTVSYLKLLKDKVRNYEAQLKRIIRQVALAAKKNDKRSQFGQTGKKLLQQGGGNSSNFQCGGSSSNTGAGKLKSAYMKLNNCSNSINLACNNQTLTLPNTVITNNCSTSMTNFKNAMDACQKEPDAATSCTCVAKPELATLAAIIRACDLSVNATFVATKISACRDAFSSCKTEVDSSGGLMHSCNTNDAALKSKIKSLTKNAAALTKAKETVKNLSARRLSWNRKRQALSSCGEVVSKVDSLLAMANADPSSPKINTVANQIIASSGVTCTADQKTALQAKDSAFDAAIEKNEETKEAALDTLEEKTGSTPSDSDIDAAEDCDEDEGCNPLKPSTSGTSNTASSGRRRRLVVEDILKRNIV